MAYSVNLIYFHLVEHSPVLCVSVRLIAIAFYEFGDCITKVVMQ